MVEPPAHRDTLIPASKYLLAFTIATFVFGVLELTKILQLPYVAWISSLSTSVVSSSSIISLMKSAGYLGLFGLMALESASLPIPSELVLPLAGYLVYIHAMNFWAAVGVSTVAGVAGALVDYAIALWLGRPFVAKLLRVSGLKSDALDRAERWFDRSGEWTVFAARFVPGLRSLISVPAGLFRMGMKSFVLMTAAGCFAWSLVLVYAGYVAGTLLTSAGAYESSATLADVLSAVIVALSAVYIGYFALMTERRRGSSRPTLGS